jgi:hypothetical protein
MVSGTRAGWDAVGAVATPAFMAERSCCRRLAADRSSSNGGSQSGTGARYGRRLVMVDAVVGAVRAGSRSVDNKAELMIICLFCVQGAAESAREG